MKAKLYAIAFSLVAMVYFVIPFDFDRSSIGILGYIDDFFFFLSAFCFSQYAFLNPAFAFASARKKLLIISIILLVCGIGALSSLIVIKP